MSRSDLVARARTGGVNDIQCYAPSAATPQTQYTIVANNVAGSPNQFILAYAPGVGDGAPSQRYGNLVGQRATTGFSSFNYPVQLTGLAATARAGAFTQYFFLDNFTSGSIGSGTHIVDVPVTSSTWNLNTAPTVGSFPAISSGWMVPNDASDFWVIDTNNFAVNPFVTGTGDSGDCYVEASLRYASNSGNAMLGIMLCVSGSSNGYYFGWNDTTLQWELGETLSGSRSTAGSFAPAVAPIVGEIHTIRLELQQSGVNFVGVLTSPIGLQGYVDGVLVIDTSGTGGFTTYSGWIAVTGGDPAATGTSAPHAMEMDWVRAGPITRLLSGQQALTAGGTAVGSTSGGGSVSVAGLVASTAQGTLVPAIGALPLGRAATTHQGTLATSTADVNVTLTGFALTTGRGALGVVETIGATGAQPFAPTFQGSFPSRKFTTASTFLNSFGPFGLLSRPPLSVNGVLRGVYEYVGAQLLSATYNPGVQGVRTYTRADGSEAQTPSAWSLVGGYNPEYHFNFAGADTTPDGTHFDYTISGGGHFSVDRDGALHWVHSRAYAYKDENPATLVAGRYRPRYGDCVYIYQSDYNVAQELSYATEADHSLPRAYVRSNVYFNKNNEHLLGIYAHSQHNVWLFWPEPFTAPLALTGLRASSAAGAIAPFTQGQSSLSGAVAATRQGTLIAKVVGTALLVGQAATLRQGALGRYDPQMVVPAYVRGDGYDWDRRAPVLLSNFSGTECFAIRDSMTVVRSGYNDTLYLIYLSGTKAAKYTPAYVGLVVLNAISGVVTSHALTAITVARPTGWGSLLTRPLQDVVKLSSGTSVTQFSLGGYILHVTWNSGTYTTPTLTQKAPPSVPALYSWFKFESFDAKGDEVYHSLFAQAQTGAPFGVQTLHVQVLHNDATGTGATWVNSSGADIFASASFTPFTEANPVSAWGDGGSTWFAYRWVPASVIESYPIGEGYALDDPLAGGAGDNDAPVTLAGTGTVFSNVGAGAEFGYQAFANQAPYLTVSSEGRIGTVSCTVVNGTVGALSGLRATTTPGTLAMTIATSDFFDDGVGDRIEGAGYQGPPLGFGGLPYIPMRSNSGWGGQIATTRQGVIFFSTPGSGAAQGLVLTTGRGVLTPTITAAFTGLLAATARGNLTPAISVALTGHGATTAAGLASGSTQVSVALLGQAATTARGALGGATTVVGSPLGRQAATARGAVVAEIAVALHGVRATSAAGTAGVLLSPSLTGLRLTSAEGVLQILHEIFLTGRSVTGVAGAVGHTADGIVNAMGVASRGAVGGVTTDLPTPGTDAQLFLRTDEAGLFTEDDEDALYNVLQPPR